MAIFRHIPSVVPLLLFLSLALSLRASRGHYNVAELIGITLLFIMTSAVILRRDPLSPRARTLEVAGTGLVLFFTLLILSSDRMIYTVAGPALSGLRDTLILAAAGAGALAFGVIRRPDHRWLAWAAGATALALLAAQAWVPFASPHPHVDVWSLVQEAVDYLIQGKNPYPQAYADIYGGAYDYRPGYNYWPFILFWTLPFKWLTGDIRFAYGAANVLTAAAFYLLARPGDRSARVHWIAPLLWLSFPVVLFNLEQAWTDHLVIVLVAWIALALRARRWTLLGVLMGLLCATKQYVVIFPVITFFQLASTESRSVAFKMAGVTTLTFLLGVAPFAWAHWPSFYEQTFHLYLSIDSRADALTWVAYFRNALGWSFPGGLSAGAYLATLGGLILWLRSRRGVSRLLPNWFGALSIMYGVVFLLGKQAFCGYYTLLAFLVLAYFTTALGGAQPKRAAPHLPRPAAN